MKTFRPCNQKRLSFLQALACAVISILPVIPVPAQTPGGTRNGTNEAPTYLRDILPIIMGKCSRCHNDQAQFVYNWLDYKTAYADRWEIKRRLWDSWKGTYFKESMPIANSPESLVITDTERLTIRDWVAHGAPRGVPPPPKRPKANQRELSLDDSFLVPSVWPAISPQARDCPTCFRRWPVRIS